MKNIKHNLIYILVLVMTILVIPSFSSFAFVGGGGTGGGGVGFGGGYDGGYSGINGSFVSGGLTTAASSGFPGGTEISCPGCGTTSGGSSTVVYPVCTSSCCGSSCPTPTPTPCPTPTPTLYVDLVANPSSGKAPLEDVDLTADVSGSATGVIKYQFDCTDNGTWDITEYNSYDPYTTYDLCDYYSGGTYTARVRVQRAGLTAEDTTQIVVDERTLSVDLVADPSSGDSPLRDVDLIADVSGSATGSIVYKFDCTNDGSWEGTYTSSSEPYTAYELCDYNSEGTYTARVLVQRDGLTAEDTTKIKVYDDNNHNPTADAGPDKDVCEGQSVMLDGSGYDSDGNYIHYRWSCETGSLSDYNIARPYFYAPQVSVNVSYYCTLTVTDDDGLTASDRMYVNIKNDCNGSSSFLTLSKTAKNQTKGDTIWMESVSSNPSDIIQFRITVTNTGTTTARNVIVRDTLPSNLSYWGGLNIDGTPSSGAILTGVNIGDLYAGQTKTIIFDTKLSPTESFGFGETSLTNTVSATGDNISQVNDTAIVRVSKSQVAGAVTEINTGMNPWIFSILISTILTVLFMLFSIFNRYLIPRNKTWRKIMDKVSLLKLYIFSN